MREIFFCALFFYMNVVTGKLCKTCEDHIDCKYYCCDNFELKEGKCQECKIGFTSMKGNACRPCNGMWYGVKCGLKCLCSSYQICHNEHGCVTRTSLETTKIGGNSKTFVTYSKYFGIHHSTCSTTTGFRNTDWNTGGISNIATVTYIAISCSFAAFVILCVICRKLANTILPSFRLGHRASMSRDETFQSVSEPNIPQSRFSFCDTIDEQNILDNVRYSSDRNACNVSLSHA